MKIKALAAVCIAAATGVVLTSCNGGGNGKPIEELKGLTTADSLSYYLGESLAGQYRQMAASDTTLKGKEAENDYVRGFLKGLELMEENSDAYRNGLMLGMQTYGMAKNMKTRYDISLNHSLMETGFRYVLGADSAASARDVQMNINVIMQRMEAMAKVKEEKAVTASLKAASEKMKGFKNLGNNLYVKVKKEGAGESVKKGDNIRFGAEVTSFDGKRVDMLCNPDIKAEVGRSLPMESVYGRTIMTMKPGGISYVLMPAEEIFHGRAEDFGYKNSDVFVVQLSLLSVGAPEQPVATTSPAEDKK